MGPGARQTATRSSWRGSCGSYAAAPALDRYPSRRRRSRTSFRSPGTSDTPTTRSISATSTRSSRSIRAQCPTRAEPGVTFTDLVGRDYMAWRRPSFRSSRPSRSAAPLRDVRPNRLSFKHGGFHDTCLEYELDWNLAPSVTRELEVRPPEYSGEPRNYAISVQRIRVQSPDSYELRAVFELEDSRKLLPWGSPPPIRAPNAGGQRCGFHLNHRPPRLTGID